MYQVPGLVQAVRMGQDQGDATVQTLPSVDVVSC